MVKYHLNNYKKETDMKLQVNMTVVIIIEIVVLKVPMISLVFTIIMIN